MELCPFYLLLSLFFQTSDSKNAFLGATHYDITIHDPPTEDDVPLAFQKVGEVVVNNVEGHLHFSLPLDPINDTLKNSERHYEEGKKRQSIGLQRYLPCIDECKRNQKGIFQCTVNDGGWKYTESCQ